MAASASAVDQVSASAQRARGVSVSTAPAPANPARRTSAKEGDWEVIASADALRALARWMAVCRGSARPRRGDPALVRATLDQAPEAGRPDRPPGAAAPAADGAPGAGSGGGP